MKVYAKSAALLLLWAASIAVLLGVLMDGWHKSKAEACRNKTTSFEDSKYYRKGGCMIKHKGKWIPLENHWEQ